MNIQAFRNVADDVLAERFRQEHKWGVQNHNAALWVTILGEEFGEVARAAMEDVTFREMRAELVQVAAVAFAAIDFIDRTTLQDVGHTSGGELRRTVGKSGPTAP